MTVLGIGHIEIYTGDRASLVDYFVSAFDFTDVAWVRTDDAQSSLLEGGDLRLLVTEGPVAAEYLDRHGDGVADIAFLCDDVAATRQRALGAGARPAGAIAVSAFGSVRHSLLPASTRYAPAGLPWVPTGETRAAGPRPGHIRSLDHIAVVLAAGELTGQVEYYADAFAFERYSSEFIEVGNQAMDSVVTRNAAATATFTLLEPVPTRDPPATSASAAPPGSSTPTSSRSSSARAASSRPTSPPRSRPSWRSAAGRGPSTSSRTTPTRPAPRSGCRRGGRCWRWPSATTSYSSRTAPTASSAPAPSCRPSRRSTPAAGWCTSAPSPRPSSPAPASATSWPTSRSRAAACSPTSW